MRVISACYNFLSVSNSFFITFNWDQFKDSVNLVAIPFCGIKFFNSPWGAFNNRPTLKIRRMVKLAVGSIPAFLDFFLINLFNWFPQMENLQWWLYHPLNEFPSIKFVVVFIDKRKYRYIFVFRFKSITLLILLHKLNLEEKEVTNDKSCMKGCPIVHLYSKYSW